MAAKKSTRTSTRTNAPKSPAPRGRPPKITKTTTTRVPAKEPVQDPTPREKSASTASADADWKSVVRIANVDTDNLVAETAGATAEEVLASMKRTTEQLAEHGSAVDAPALVPA